MKHDPDIDSTVIVQRMRRLRSEHEAHMADPKRHTFHPRPQNPAECWTCGRDDAAHRQRLPLLRRVLRWLVGG